MSINLLIIPVILISSYFGYLDEYILMFLALVLHEAAHLFQIKKNYIEISKLKIEPFGIRITLKDEIIKNPKDEIKLAVAGPLFSIISGIIFLFVYLYIKNSEYIYFFASANIYLGIFNLLPAFPADGGRILKAILSMKTGYIKSYNFVRKLTLIISL